MTIFWKIQFGQVSDILGEFFMFLITVICGISFITFDSMFQLIDNEFFPKYIKPIIILSIVFLIGITVCRFDLLMAEWNGSICVLKVFYYLQENIKSKHGLTNSNNKKLTYLVKIFEVLSIFVLIFYVITMSLILLYISIKSSRITLHILTPFLIYMIWLSITTYIFCIFTGISGVYYYFLLFSQINDQINMIYQKSEWFLTSLHRICLSNLTNKHNLLAIQIYEINFVVRRTLLAFYIDLALTLVISLNIILKTDVWIEIIFYLSAVICAMVFGFTISYCLSELTKTAHKPHEIIYKLIRKPNPLPFKWKVTFSLSFLTLTLINI